MLEITTWLFQKVNTFPKKQRFVLGQQIQNSSLACQRLIIEANNARSGKDTYHKLMNLNVELAVLRDLLRIAYEVQFMKASSLQFIIERIDEVGKMCGGWANRYKLSKSET